jgi:hypothetical protein
LAAAVSVAAGKPNPRSLEAFRWDQEPKKADWRYFMKASDGERKKLWEYHEKAGHKLGQWAWGWRLGWVRACGESKEAYCEKLLQAALFDKALVVRAEAATRFGRRYDGTKNAGIVSLLADAFRNKENVRNGAPLFVDERILFALHQVGGEQALKAGTRLAAQYPATAAYWKKLGPAD